MKIRKRQLLGITVASLTLLGIVSAAQTTSITGKAEVVTSQSSKATLPNPGLTVNEITINKGKNPFRDISGSSFKNYIQWVYEKGITTGFTPTTYNPKGNVTRGEMAVFLWRLSGSPSYNPPFNVYNDVTNYKNQILWLTAVQVTTGTAPRYNPNGNVTRGQMAAFMHRVYQGATGVKDNTKYPVPYADSKNHMFANDIGWLKTTGITDTPTSFRPDASVTREEMSAFLQRFYNKLPKNKGNVTVKNSTLKVGDKWDKKSNFVSAKDANGKAADFSKVTVTGTVDTSKAGTTTVTYSYGGKSAKATVTVVNTNQTDLQVTPTHTFYIGDNWDPKSLITKVTDKDGKPVDPSAVTIDDKMDTTTAGTYDVTYTYGGLTKTSTVTVKLDPNAPVLNENAGTVDFMGQTWDVIQNKGDGNYEIAARNNIGNSQFNSGTVYFSADDNSLDGYKDSLVKRIVDKWYEDNIATKAYEKFVVPVTLKNPTLGDMKTLGGWTSNTAGQSIPGFKAVNQPDAFPTVVDTTNGSKQAFLMSGSDMSDGTGTYGNLTNEALKHRDALEAVGIDNSWLRSSGTYYNYAANLYSGNTVVYDDDVNSTNAVVPSLVVHIP